MANPCLQPKASDFRGYPFEAPTYTYYFDGSASGGNVGINYIQIFEKYPHTDDNETLLHHITNPYQYTVNNKLTIATIDPAKYIFKIVASLFVNSGDNQKIFRDFSDGVTADGERIVNPGSNPAFSLYTCWKANISNSWGYV